MSPSPGCRNSTATGRAPLTPAEMAQIAGRAGRGMRDGTFGTHRRLPAAARRAWSRAVEAHSFEPLDQLCWRNSDLDFSAVDALLATPDRAAARAGPGARQRCDRPGDADCAGARARDPRHRRSGRGVVRAAVGSLPDPRFPQARRRHAHAAVRARVRPHRARRRAADRLAGRPDRRAGRARTATSTR